MGTMEYQFMEEILNGLNTKLKLWASGSQLIQRPPTATLNNNEKLDKVRNVLNCWKYRRLTPIGKITKIFFFGKITVLKSLVASQLPYVLSPLHTNEKAIKDVNQ